MPSHVPHHQSRRRLDSAPQCPPRIFLTSPGDFYGTDAYARALAAVRARHAGAELLQRPPLFLAPADWRRRIYELAPTIDSAVVITTPSGVIDQEVFDDVLPLYDLGRPVLWFDGRVWHTSDQYQVAHYPPDAAGLRFGCLVPRPDGRLVRFPRGGRARSRGGA